MNFRRIRWLAGVALVCLCQIGRAGTLVFPADTAFGGYVKESAEDSNVGDTNNVVPGNVLWVGDTAYRKQVKGFASFDTSILPDDVVVTNAILRLRRLQVKGVNPFVSIGGAYVDINLSGGFGGDLALAGGDFEARADGAEIAAMSRPTEDGDWSEGIFDELGCRGINLDGYTQLRIYHISDDNDDGEADQIGYDSAELAVEYMERTQVERSVPLIDPDRFHGLRTKWEKYFEGTNGATRASIVPEMRGLNHTQWAQAIERTGANGCTLNLEARNNLLQSAAYPVADLTPERVSAGLFTPDQRNAEQLRFLLGLEKALEQGRILGSFGFHVHQRLYPNHDPVKEQQFVDDCSGFINSARALRLDHWLRGIRLGENGIDKTDLDYSMELAKWWANEINARTENWLLSHGMEMHGGKFGIYFNDIDSRRNSETFFQRMREKTGYFSWCFKFFHDENFNAAMEDAGLDSSTVSDIKTFLRTECGFADLEAFVHANRTAYPMHANCIFVGDSGDAMKLIGEKKLQALTEMFNEAGDGFRGIVAVNGYAWEDESALGDVYKTLYIVEPTGAEPVLNPASYARWSAWPNVETGSVDPMETIDAHVGQPFLMNLNASIESGAGWLVASNGIAAGTPSVADLGVNAFRIRSATGVEKTLLVTVLDRLHLAGMQLSTRTAPKRNYELTVSDNLSSNVWTSAGPSMEGDGSVWEIELSPTNNPAYYKMNIEQY